MVALQILREQMTQAVELFEEHGDIVGSEKALWAVKEQCSIEASQVLISELFTAIGWCQRYSGEFEKAKSSFEAAIGYDWNNEKAKAALFRLYFTQGKYKKANQAFRSAWAETSNPIIVDTNRIPEFTGVELLEGMKKRHILLLPALGQGIGDQTFLFPFVLEFKRRYPDVRITLACDHSLTTVFARSAGAVGYDDMMFINRPRTSLDAAKLPLADYHCFTGRLPGILDFKVEDYFNFEPTLRVDIDLLKHYRQEYDKLCAQYGKKCAISFSYKSEGQFRGVRKMDIHSDEAKEFFGLEDLLFVNFQFDVSDEERALFESYGTPVIEGPIDDVEHYLAALGACELGVHIDSTSLNLYRDMGIGKCTKNKLATKEVFAVLAAYPEARWWGVHNAANVTSANYGGITLCQAQKPGDKKSAMKKALKGVKAYLQNRNDGENVS